MAVSDKRVVLGIDPGTLIMGVGVIEIQHKGTSILFADAIKFSSKMEHPYRLKLIFEEITKLIDMYNPCEIAIESPFYGKNVQSMLKLGRAQGVCMAAGMSRGLDVSEYPARRVKQAITGNGNASKEQVATMIQAQFSYSLDGKKMDATDAIAIALCHVYTFGKLPSNKVVTKGKKKTTWEKYLDQNPSKIIYK